MELLSPAGSFEALKAAVLNGADAVYFGGGAFNARINAANFSNDEIVKAIDYCHSRNVLAYITLNTLIYDRELKKCIEYARFLYNSGADAFIVQDLGLFHLLKKYLPEIELHASTQMGISSLDGVRLCEKMGASQVVLSRELSLNDIDYIHKNSQMKLECFVHGAMCVSFSGGCLFSSLVGGRSGNRGDCAQPCRKQMAANHVPSKEEYNLSIADMCMIEHIDDMKSVGVHSLKIEGRMKKPEYVAAVTNAYRQAINGVGRSEIQKLKEELSLVFSRGEFSSGYFYGTDIKNNCVAKAQPDKELKKRLQESFRRDKPIHPVTFTLTMKADEAAVLTATSRKVEVNVVGGLCEKSDKQNNEETIERYKTQLKKLGGTPYFYEDSNIIIDNEHNLHLPVSAINDMRNKAIEKIELAKRKRRNAPEIDIPQHDSDKSSCENEKISVRVVDYLSAIAAYETGADEVTIDALSYAKEDIEKLFANKPNDRKLNIALPIALIGVEYQRMIYDIVESYPFDAVEVNNLGQIEALKGKTLIGGCYLNVYNSQTVEVLKGMGLKSITLSPELTKKECRELMEKHDGLRFEVFGRAVLMNLFSCPIRNERGCIHCDYTSRFLNDSERRRFPILEAKNTSPCAMVRLMNCFTMDNIAQIPNIKTKPSAYVLFFCEGDTDIVVNRINALKDAMTGGKTLPLKDTTRGYWNR